jgi:hypothetical protein
MPDREWSIYRNSAQVPDYVVAKQSTPGHPFFTAGPFTWAEAAQWMRNHGIPGW